MKALNALQAALEFGGWNLPQDAHKTDEEIREYFTSENFQNMFGDDCEDCGGYTFDECAQAVIDWQNELKA